MAKTKLQKNQIASELKEKIKKAKGMVLVKYDNLPITQTDELRREAKKERMEFYVAKKSLFDIAAKEENIEQFDRKAIGGGLGVLFSYDDEVAPSKLIAKIIKGHTKKGEPTFAIHGGILEKRVINDKEVTALSKLPSKEELMGQVVGTIAAPLSGFINVLEGNMKNLFYALEAIRDRK
ncbi:MAG: 50S ribosomal protein L10 [Parcubacteria group bacterium]|nr:50S ribosomal protein L10 [Parcubacteria group bacterium]